MYKNKAHIICFGLLMVAGIMGSYTVPFLVAYYADVLNFTESASGNAGMIEVFCIAIASIASSFFINIWDKRFISLFWAIVFLVSQVLSSIVDSYSLIIFFRALVGVSSGVLLAVVNKLISQTDNPEEVYGITLAFSSIVLSVVLFFMPYIYDSLGEIGMFVFLAIFGVLTLCAVVSMDFTEFSDKQIESVNNVQKGDVKIIAVIVFFIAITSLYTVAGGTWAYTERISASIDIDTQRLGLLLSLSTVFGVFGAYSAALLGLKLGRIVPVVLGFVVSGVSCLLISIAVNELLFSAGVMIYGFSYMFTLSYVLGLASDLDSSGRVVVATNGYLLIPYSLGVSLYASLGVTSMESMGYVAFLICSLSSLLVAAVAMTIRDRSNRVFMVKRYDGV